LIETGRGEVVGMKRVIALNAALAIFIGLGVASAAGPRFTARSLRGRYTGNAVVSEDVAEGGGTNAELQANEIVIENFDGNGIFTGAVTVVCGRLPAAARR
jgi:hypothetical protein